MTKMDASLFELDLLITSFTDALDLAQQPPISLDGEEPYLKNERCARSEVAGRSPLSVLKGVISMGDAAAVSEAGFRT